MDDSPTPRKILILDDNPIDREICRRYLTRSETHQYTLVEQNTVEGALDTVRKEHPDCILLDYHLNDGTGVEFLHELDQAGGTKLYPVVMLTGTGNESIAVQVMKAGAQDYLVKDRLNAELLQRTVEAAIFKVNAERQLEMQRAEMEQLFLETQEANARKDQFLAALSHELRTPLTPVLAAVTADGAANATPDELRNIFSVIRRNVELEARLIDDLLDLTRISRGKLEVDLRTTDLHKLLQHAVDTCQEDITQKSLKLEWHLLATDHVVQCDPARLQQVFWNLLKNAVKFTPRGGSIHVSTRNDGAGHIETEVRDTGMGIEPSILERIFDAFEQGSPEITRRFGGLGLGLAIAKALVDAHGGHLHAMSDPTVGGATFTVCLENSNLPLDEPSPTITIPEREELLVPRRLLLVEDHLDTARILSRIMSSDGCQVKLAGSISDAEALYKAEEFDCVISDIGLPDGTGMELIQRLSDIRPVRAIALSGYGTEQDVERSRAAGFAQHLTKPVHWPKLQKALNEVLGEMTVTPKR